MKIENPTTGKVYKDAINRLFGLDIEQWGDSLIDFEWSDKLQALLDSRTVTKNGFGGKQSSYIRDQFLSNGDISKAQIFWVGRNGGNVDNVIDDLRVMVEHLSHDMFLIMTIPNGGYANNLSDGDAYARFVDFADRIKSIYPNNTIDNRAACIQGWDMGGVKLNTSFTQPTIGQNVQINVTDAAFLNSVNSNDVSNFPQWDNQIRIGNMYDADLYTIISVDDSNLITVRLDEVNTVNEGATVENGDTDGSVKYIKVVQEMDWQCFQFDTTPSTFRSDGVHMTDSGKQFIAELVARFFNARFI